MPKVGQKEFDYTKEGKEAAKQYAKSTNQPIEGEGEASYLVANGEMTQDEVDKYIKPQITSGEGGYPLSDARKRKTVSMGYGDNDNPYKNLK